jgi:hypothetical protein
MDFASKRPSDFLKGPGDQAICYCSCPHHSKCFDFLTSCRAPTSSFFRFAENFEPSHCLDKEFSTDGSACLGHHGSSNFDCSSSRDQFCDHPSFATCKV